MSCNIIEDTVYGCLFLIGALASFAIGEYLVVLLYNKYRHKMIKKFKAEGPQGIYTGEIEVMFHTISKEVHNNIIHEIVTKPVKEWMFIVRIARKEVARIDWMMEEDMLKKLFVAEEELQKSLEFKATIPPSKTLEQQLRANGYE